MPSHTLSISIPSSIEELVSLETRARKDKAARTHYKAVLPYVHSSLTRGRHLDRAILLAVGETGRGKSKTINTLVGLPLLSFARGNSKGSTTKAIQRISFQHHDSEAGIGITLCYDDTPGFGDTTDADRERIQELIRNYGDHFYPDRPRSVLQQLSGENFREKVYPNVIFLVTSWDRIKGNQPSSICEPMDNLNGSGLIDHLHPNVIVVVTKSLSSMIDYEDCDSKDDEWRKDAAAKTHIIDNIRSERFPSSKPWPIVFIENGGGKEILREYRNLPNGERSHQNLFDAIFTLFGGTDGREKEKDLVGLHALRILTGDENVVRGLESTPVQILFQLGDKAPIPADHWCHLRQLAKTRLGVSYNPIYKSFGRIPIIAMNNSDIDINMLACYEVDKITYCNHLEEGEHASESQLRVDFSIPAVSSVGLGVTSRTAAKSVRASVAQMFKVTKRTAVTSLKILTPMLSNDICHVINRLPRWDDSSDLVKGQYVEFFGVHGTHVNVQAALGGVLRIAVQHRSTREESEMLQALQASSGVPLAPNVGAKAETFASGYRKKFKATSSAKGLIAVDRIGGVIDDAQLTTTLNQLFAFFCDRFPGTPPTQGWVDVRTTWIDSLKTDPAFCPRDPETRYLWLSDCGGLLDRQKSDLKKATDWYLRTSWRQTSSLTESLREGNKKRVETAIQTAKESWWNRFKGRVQFWTRK